MVRQSEIFRFKIQNISVNKFSLPPRFHWKIFFKKRHESVIFFNGDDFSAAGFYKKLSRQNTFPWANFQDRVADCMSAAAIMRRKASFDFRKFWPSDFFARIINQNKSSLCRSGGFPRRSLQVWPVIVHFHDEFRRQIDLFWSKDCPNRSIGQEDFFFERESGQHKTADAPLHCRRPYHFLAAHVETNFPQAADEDVIEFQAFGGVDGHQFHRILAFNERILISRQSSISQKASIPVSGAWPSYFPAKVTSSLTFSSRSRSSSVPLF